MYKKICSLLALILVSLCFVGCGELSFDETPYGDSPKTNAEIVTFYTQAKAACFQLQARYEGTVVQDYGTTHQVNKKKYTVGKYGNYDYCSIEDEESINGVVTKVTTQVWYKDYLYTTVEDKATETTEKTKQYTSTTNIRRNVINELFNDLYEDSIETTGYKQYDKTNYYKLTLTKKSVNDEFSYPLIDIPEGYYINSFGYEFGVNSNGYICYIVNTFSLIDESYMTTPSVVQTYTSSFKLMSPYGSSMYMPEPPNEADTSYVEK